jgi:hypothetical protein
MGNSEHAMADSPAAAVSAVNTALRHQPEVMFLAVDAATAVDGFTQWHDPVLWHRAKRETHPRVSHIYGEHDRTPDRGGTWESLSSAKGQETALRHLGPLPETSDDDSELLRPSGIHTRSFNRDEIQKGERKNAGQDECTL